MFEVTVTKIFSAAHKLIEVGGACENLHGHNFTVEVTISSEKLTAEGIVIDFREVKKHLNEVIGYLDHKCLNEIPEFAGMNPSSENIARFIHERLSRKINREKLATAKVTIWESDDARVSYS